MKTKTQTFSKLTPVFSFAGFTWPRYVPLLPKGDFKKRIEQYKKQVCGPYYHAPEPLKSGGRSTFCYLDSDFMPGLRWSWCDDIPSNWDETTCHPDIRHTGWFCDTDQNETIRGIVFKLPHNRGYLAGWSMGEGMATAIDYDVIPDIDSAVYAADSMAENTAEKEREYQESMQDENEDC